MSSHACSGTIGCKPLSAVSGWRRSVKLLLRRRARLRGELFPICGTAAALLFCLLLCVLPLVAFPEQTCAQEDIPVVLIIDAYHHGEGWADAEIAGLLATLQEHYPDLEPSIEHLDAKRFPDPQNLERMKAFLVEKYRDRPVDLVIALDNPALDFVLDTRDRVFQDVPVVFAGVSGFDPAMLDGQAGITGVIEDHDLAANLELLLALHPGTRHILAIHDYTGTGLAVRQEMMAVMPRFADRVRIDFNEPVSMDELRAEIAALPPDALVMLLTFVTDSEGKTFTRATATELITSASSVPVYALHENRLGFGIVGGYLLAGEEHGRQAAEIAVRILAGEDPETIPVTHSRSRPMFDDAQLRRFDIAESRLPPNSVLINKPDSLWAQYKGWIMAALGAILVEGALIVLLIALWRRSGRAEQALRTSEAQLREVINSMEKAISVYEAVDDGKDFVFVDMNEFGGADQAPQRGSARHP